MTEPPVVLTTEQFEVYAADELQDMLRAAAVQLENRIESYEGTGSGWKVAHLVALDTTVWKLDPLRASTYHPLPKWVQNTKCVVNIKNNGNECFRHAVVGGLYAPSDPTHPGRVNSYRYAETEADYPNFEKITYPMKLNNIRFC